MILHHGSRRSEAIAGEREVASMAMPQDLRPRLPVLVGGGAAIAVVSFATLPWPAAIASLALGTLMIAGADVDARTFLLPDTVTLGGLLVGLVAAFALNPQERWLALEASVARAAGAGAMLWLVRWGYARLRHREGLGFGDVKLAACIGAWLPLDLIPTCFALAASSALMLILYAYSRGRKPEATTRIPFGAFLCPALWVVFYSSAVAS